MEYYSGTFGYDSFSLEYSCLFHIPKNGNFSCCSIFWNIPGIFHIPENLVIIMLSNFSGIFHFVKFNFFWNSEYSKKINLVLRGRKV